MVIAFFRRSKHIHADILKWKSRHDVLPIIAALHLVRRAGRISFDGKTVELRR
jgi:hypothetical protein